MLNVTRQVDRYPVLGNVSITLGTRGKDEHLQTGLWLSIGQHDVFALLDGYAHDKAKPAEWYIGNAIRTLANMSR